MTDTNLPITRVALYTSGVGYFERGGVIDGDVTHTLLFPIDQVNDVLKSLVLLDTGGGTIQPVTYAARDPQDKQLQAFSIDLSDNPDQATLLKRLRGTAITVQTTASDVPSNLTGIIVGVEYHTITLPEKAGTTKKAILNLLTDAGLFALSLEKISSLQILDTKINDELRQALQIIAEGRDSSKRPVTLAFSGEGSRHVLIGYLTETPLWQTTYRLVLGTQPKLQGWALVQNTSQDDWTNVRLSLISGRPISFIQDLYQPLYVPRPTVAPQVEASPTPQAYGGALSSSVGEFMDCAPADNDINMLRRHGAAPAVAAELNDSIDFMMMEHDKGHDINFAPTERFQSLETTGEKLGAALFSYQIDVPVTVPRQQSAMIPFVASEIEAERISIYNRTVALDHPLAGARVKNTTTLNLMGGPLTVFEEIGQQTGYVGDALIDHTEPNQTRLISYAIDQAVAADCKVKRGETEIQSIVIAKGALKITRTLEETTVYRFNNNAVTPRLIVIEHPDDGEFWTLVEPQAADERTANAYRFEMPLESAESKEFAVRMEYPISHETALVSVGLGALVTYARQEGATPAVKKVLEAVLAKRQALSQIEQQIYDLNGKLRTVETGQKRIRENMNSLDHSSSLYKRYVSQLDTQETTIQKLTTQRDALQNDLIRAQAALSDYVAGLNLN